MRTYKTRDDLIQENKDLKAANKKLEERLLALQEAYDKRVTRGQDVLVEYEDAKPKLHFKLGEDKGIHQYLSPKGKNKNQVTKATRS